MRRAIRIPLLALTLLLVALPAGATLRLFRPLLADPRENQFRMKWVHSTEDWRYGTDVADSLSKGGSERRTGTTWDVGFGETFRADPWTRFLDLGHCFPGIQWWERYQMGIPAGVFANFDRSGAELINADYQFGLSMDMLLAGAYSDTLGVNGFDRTVWTLRVMGFHRSTHLGDEYLSEGAFGRNQLGFPDAGQIFDRPPVKRYNLSFESARVIMSAEKAPGFFNHGRSTFRGYGGFEKKFKLATHEPANFTSAIYQAGVEFRSSGNQKRPHEGWFTRFENLIYPAHHEVDTEWIGALDLKLAKPYEFALMDAPPGATSEVWTPHLWTVGTGGREFRNYAGSWHAMLGVVTYQRSQRDVRDPKANRPNIERGFLPQEAILAVDWYCGYSPNGQFLDQRLHYRPIWMPSLTVHF